MRLAISICTFNDGTFDVMFQDAKTGEELTLSGARKLNEEEFDFANRIGPACVWTEYERVPDGKSIISLKGF